METDRLRYFCTIYETESLSKAAELLRVSHSGLSKAMSVLQEELGVSLFRPVGRGIQPSEEAHEVYKRSKELLRLLESLTENHTEPPRKCTRIGLTEIFSHSLAGKLPDLFPGEDLEIHELDAGEIEITLLDGRIDFGISFIPFPRPELEYLKIAEVGFGAFKREGALRSIKQESLPFVIPISLLPTNPLSLKIRDGWPAGISRETPFRTSSLTIALQLARSGNAAIFLPHFLAAAQNLHEIEYPARAFAKSKREIYIVKKKNSDETQAMKAVARMIRVSCSAGARQPKASSTPS